MGEGWWRRAHVRMICSKKSVLGKKGKDREGENTDIKTSKKTPRNTLKYS